MLDCLNLNSSSVCYHCDLRQMTSLNILICTMRIIAVLGKKCINALMFVKYLEEYSKKSWPPPLPPPSSSCMAALMLYQLFHFTHGETEDQRGARASLRSHSESQVVQGPEGHYFLPLGLCSFACPRSHSRSAILPKVPTTHCTLGAGVAAIVCRVGAF